MKAKLFCRGLLSAVILFGSVGQTSAASYNFTFLEMTDAIAINNLGQVAGTGIQSATPAIWDSGTVINLSTLGGGLDYGIGLAINNTGQVVGSSSDLYGTVHRATSWSNTTANDLGTLGGADGIAWAINDTGQVAGNSSTVGGAQHAAVWNGATVTDLGTLGGVDSGANGINNLGQVVGYSSTAGNTETHATIWNGATATDLGTLGGTYSQAYAINNAGFVVGTASTAGDLAYHATLWNGTVAKDLDSFSRLDGFSSTANAINNNGQVVGWATNTNNDQWATLWDGSTTTDLNSFLDGVSSGAGWKLISANGINNKGAIVGTAYNYQTFQSKGFLLSVTAVPEPETYGMLLVGFGLIGSVLRRRKTS